jgi:3-deoxy-D-manno-octulosonic-acid transferase
MLMLAYSALLTLGLLLGAPWWLFRMATTERYREGLRQRLGFVPAALRAVVSGKRVVWLHAVSVGEVLAATRLVAELGAALGEGSARNVCSICRWTLGSRCGHICRCCSRRRSF